MSQSLSRRTFLASLGALACNNAIPSFAATPDQAGRIRFGYTAMTWGNEERQAIDESLGVGRTRSKTAETTNYRSCPQVK